MRVFHHGGQRMKLIGVHLLGAVSAFAAFAAGAAVTSTVVDLAVPNGTLRYLDVRPDTPYAMLIAFAGGQGYMGIQSDGTFTTIQGRCSAVGRNRQAFADHGYEVVLVDDVATASTPNMQALIDHLRQRTDVPVWVVGMSSSTELAAELAASLPASARLGAAFLSPITLGPALLATIRRPSLVLINANDADQSGSQVYAALTAVPAKRLTILSGGTNAACNGIGYHVFYGIEAAFVDAITGFVDAYNDTLTTGPGSAAPATVVEYYNAALDHYFVTWQPAEQANLDAGNTPTRWNRTGQTFKVFTTAQTGTSPVCRYYIPPGLGDSHFFGRGMIECDATGQKNPTFVLEEPNFMFVTLPTAGVCPPGTTSIYRAFSNRTDANHRYMTDRAIRSQMVAAGWLAEGDGPDLVVMCAQ